MKKGEVALKLVYVLEHLWSDSPTETQGLAPFLGFLAESIQGWIKSGTKLGQWGVLSPKELFFRLEGYSDKPNAW